MASIIKVYSILSGVRNMQIQTPSVHRSEPGLFLVLWMRGLRPWTRMAVQFLLKSLKNGLLLLLNYQFTNALHTITNLVKSLTSEWRLKVDTCFKNQFHFVSVLIVKKLTWLTSRNGCSSHASALHHCYHPHLSRFPCHAVPGKIYRAKILLHKILWIQ